MADEWPLCLTRPVARIPIGLTRLDVVRAVLESRVAIDSKRPSGVLVLDLIQDHDPIRSESDQFILVSEGLKQSYTYAKPADAAEFRSTIESCNAELVILDTHGHYDRRTDTLSIGLGATTAAVEELLPQTRVPPVWVLSACDTSVTGAMRGCFVRALLAKGAACVIATLTRVDAFVASMFVGRLLTEIFNPVVRGGQRTLAKVFFDTQVTTALLYDPVLPVMRRSMGDKGRREALGHVFSDFFSWARGARLTARELRVATAWVLGEAMARHGLTDLYVAAHEAGQLRPETLLFSAFGAPNRVEILE